MYVCKKYVSLSRFRSVCRQRRRLPITTHTQRDTQLSKRQDGVGMWVLECVRSILAAARLGLGYKRAFSLTLFIRIRLFISHSAQFLPPVYPSMTIRCLSVAKKKKYCHVLQRVSWEEWESRKDSVSTESVLQTRIELESNWKIATIFSSFPQY